MTTRMPGVSLREFMNQKSGGSKQSYLKWKDRKDHAATVWLHPQASILGLWRHGFQRIQVIEDKATRVTTKEVYYDPLLCYEADEVNESQNWRDRETGRREKPPVLCPMCLLIEHLYQLVQDRKLDWRTPLFRFEGTDPQKTKILHVGGVTGMFNSRKLSDAQKAELGGLLPGGQPDPKWTPASRWFGPIYQNRAFMQDIRPRKEYVFTIVDNDDVAKGIQVTFETSSIGDKTRDVNAKSIKEARSAQDPEGAAGDIQLHPYAVRWEYDEHAQEPSKKYDAMKMGRTPLTPAIDALLRATPPDVSKHAERFNLKTLRARVEQHLILPGLKPHLDKYFEKALKAEEEEKSRAPAPAPEPRTPEVGTRVPSQLPVTSVPFGQAGWQIQAPNIHEPPAEEDIFGCDKTPGCPGEMRATDPECPVCHAVYEVVGAEPPPPPKLAALKPRSAVGNGLPPIPPAALADPSLQGPDSLGLTPESQGISAPDLGDAAEPAAGGWPGDPSADIPF